MGYEEMLGYINTEIREQKLVQAKLAREIIISPETLNNYLKGNRMMPADVMLKLLSTIGKPLQLMQITKIVKDSKVVLGDA